MTLTFIEPLLLFGLAAGILPILIHRLTQKKALVRKFSAVRLLLQSQQVRARPQRLKHLLLLVLRILAVMSLVFMMARPVLLSQGFASLEAGGARAVVLDNSLSMGFREERGERYAIAKKAVKESLKDFEGQVMILPTVNTADTRAASDSWLKPDEAMKAVDRIPLQYGRGDPMAALRSAYRKLRELKVNREILFVTDLARRDWDVFNLCDLGVIPDANITFFRVGGPGRDPNLSVKHAGLVKGDAVLGTPARLEVVVGNWSGQNTASLVELYLSGVKVDQKSVSVNAGEEGKVFFDLFLNQPGWIDGEVRLQEDRLPSDDRFYFTFKVRDKVKVLVVDGDPRTSLKESESYYLTNALRPGGLDDSPFRVQVVAEAELPHLDLRSYEALFLLNVALPEPGRVASFLESGKPVFIFLGDRILPEQYHALPFFPWAVKEIRNEGGKPERIAEADQGHRVIRSLSSEGGSLKKASFYRYFAVQGGGKVLLALENRLPLLLKAPLGDRKLYLFTSTADLEWNDFPLQASFLPTIQGMVKEAVGLTDHSSFQAIEVGEGSGEAIRPVQIKGVPQGPGIYQFSHRSEEVCKAINPPFEESDLSKLAEGELRKRFGRVEVRILEYREEELKQGHSGKKELWPLLLAFLLLVVAAEMALANGMARKSIERRA